MKSASFYIVSITLHLALLLAYPLPRAIYVATEFVPVTVLSFAAAESGAGNDLPTAKTNTTPKPTRAAAPNSALRQPETVEPAISMAKNQPSVEEVSNLAAWMVLSGSPMLDVTAAVKFGAIATNENSPGTGSNGAGAGESDGDMSGIGLGPRGSGTGNGFGTGRGIGSRVMQLTQVSFRHAPPPDYPDAARKDGKEGRVLLRVLVDEEGRSKFVEINLGSGSRVLDQAAAEAVKSWRFSPARYGDKAVESWVKIPVDFRLTEARD